MKEWKPLRDFKKADFPFNENSQISEKKEIKTNDEQQKKQIKKWQPPTIQSINKTSQPKKIVSSIAHKVQQNKIIEENNTQMQKSKQDMTQLYINNSIVTNPTIIVDILRKWYWEKNTNAHKKIFIILRSLTKENFIYLMQYFTTMEKKQLIEIYKKNIKPQQTEILTTRQEFIHLLNELS